MPFVVSPGSCHWGCEDAPGLGCVWLNLEPLGHPQAEQACRARGLRLAIVRDMAPLKAYLDSVGVNGNIG